LAGTLDIELVNGFTPKAGDEFVILDYDRVDGRFQLGEGLFGLHDNVWFELVQTGSASSAGQLKLVARELLPGLGQALPLDSVVGAGVLDGIGRVLNTPYFGAGASVSFAADLLAGDWSLDNSAFSLSWDSDRDRALLGVDAALEIDGAMLDGDLTISLPMRSGEDIEVGIEDGSLVLTGGGVRLAADDIEGGFVLASDGVAGVLTLGTLALTQADGSALPGLDVATIRSAHLGFNTTGRAAQGEPGTVAFDFSEGEHHDFLAVSADLDLGLSYGGVSYTLGGRFGISRESMALVEGQPAQHGWLLTAFDAATALTVGSAPGGVRLALKGLQGGMVLATVADGSGGQKTGFAGSLQVGEIALTEADGVTPLVAGLDLSLRDLPFDFSTFDLAGLDLTPELPEIDLSVGAFPFLDLSTPSLPRFNLPGLGSLNLGIDWDQLSLPELGLTLLSLPGLDLELPDVDLGPLDLTWA
jgi:hypothetical protein